MHLVVDVGNTETALGLFRPGATSVGGHWRYSTTVPRTEDELFLLYRALLREGGVELESLNRIVVGSVVPSHTDTLARALRRLASMEVVHVDSARGLPIHLDVEEPLTVGADRIVNTLAAAQLFGQDTVVVDLGTATTYDCISGDGVFLGGVIAPGLKAGQLWLKGHTAKLPGVDFAPPDRVIGRRTEACLRSGIFHGAVAAVDGIVDLIRQEWERPEALVVSTGGWAQLLSPHSRTIQQIHPHLTLVGLELAGRWLTGDGVSLEGRDTVGSAEWARRAGESVAK